jgi:hypothetical protein
MAKISIPQKKQGKNIKLPENEALSLDNQTFTFSFEYVQKGYCFSKLEKNERVALVNSLFKRKDMSWREIRQSDRHGLGIEEISSRSLRASMPTISFINQETVFHAMRFDGKKAMVGVRVEKVFYVLWFDRSFTLYNH